MNYRFYSFVNFYLSSIQQGVQTAHLVAEMFSQSSGFKLKTLQAWAENDKTLIILNGGAAKDIRERFLFLSREAASTTWPAPTACFSEDQDSLDGTMTCCGIVVPEYIWAAMDYKTALREGIIDEETRWVPNGYFYKNAAGDVIPFASGTADHNIIATLKSCGLAR